LISTLAATVREYHSGALLLEGLLEAHRAHEVPGWVVTLLSANPGPAPRSEHLVISKFTRSRDGIYGHEHFYEGHVIQGPMK